MTVEWKKSFGEIKQGEPVKLAYSILNAGNQPLIFENYEVACTCTTVDFPSHPIAPGQTATITVSFKSNSAIGRQDRIVQLFSNDPKSPIKLRFKGSVAVPK